MLIYTFRLHLPQSATKLLIVRPTIPEEPIVHTGCNVFYLAFFFAMSCIEEATEGDTKLLHQLYAQATNDPTPIRGQMIMKDG